MKHVDLVPAGVRSVLLALLVTALALTACDSVDEQPPDLISFDAVVVMTVLPGPNTWVLDDLASNASYYPINLPAEFHEEGLRVYVEGYRIRSYKVLLHEPVEIRTITVLADPDV